MVPRAVFRRKLGTLRSASSESDSQLSRQTSTFRAFDIEQSLRLSASAAKERLALLRQCQRARFVAHGTVNT